MKLDWQLTIVNLHPNLTTSPEPHGWCHSLLLSWHTVLDSHENLPAPACKSREDAWPEVPGWVDGVARVEAHRQADDQHHEAYSEGLQAWRDRTVAWIDYGQDAHDQRRRPNDLR